MNSFLDPERTSSSLSAKIALVGCGAVIEELHAPALLELERRGVVSVSALFDPDETRRRALRTYFPMAQELRCLEEIKDSGCTAALVASPARFHAEQTVACLEAGLSVLCEKPMAASTLETEAMIAAARTANRLLAVGLVRRHCATTQLIKRIIEGKRFGPVTGFRVVEGGSFGWAAKSASFFRKDAGGGGVLTDTGIHTIDLLLWWFGVPANFSYEDDAMGGVEANCRLALDYRTFCGEIQMTRDYEIPTGYFFEFEHAWIYWQPYAADHFEIGFPGSHHSLRSKLVTTEVEDRRPVRHRIAEPFSHVFLRQWENFIGSIHGRETLCVSGEEAAKSVTFIEKCYAARSFMEPTWFTEREKKKGRELHRGVSE